LTNSEKAVSAVGQQGVNMDEQERAYAREVGKRLRSVRKQQRYSLQAVEAMSKQEFKASVLGAYERGERSISVPRLQRLAEFYKVSVDQLLPRNSQFDGFVELSVGERAAKIPAPDDTIRIDLVGLERQDSAARVSACPDEVKCSIDLTQLAKLAGPERDLLQRYLEMIQISRQDFNGRVMTVRSDDIKILGAVLGLTFGEMLAYLDQLGLRVSS
jgi:transcriptional regulator with XRE-family HTH domain